MIRIRRLFWLAPLVVLVAAGWLWWVKPRQVDMAMYAPANSLLYLESNRPLEVVDALRQTQAWKIFDPTGPQNPTSGRSWLQRFMRWTGIGPINSVILARAQLAVVITDLGTSETGDTLNIRPEGALVVQTHTSAARTRGSVESALRQVAEKAYGKPTQEKITIDGVDFLKWTAPSGDRQIVASISGTLVIVGNTQQAVQSCLAVAQGRQPNLKSDPELVRMRQQLASEKSLTFGYVPSANSARLLSVGVPLLFGRAPGDSDFQRLITTSAAKVVGSIGWTSQSYSTGIEDRYMISLQPAVVTRLKPNFSPLKIETGIEHLLPGNLYSVTSYKFEDPSATWQSFKTAVSSQVDALSAVLFSTILKSALLDYGIEQPEMFLASLRGDVLTIRLTPDGERWLLIAGLRNKEQLREMLTGTMSMRPRPGTNVDLFEHPREDLAAILLNEFMVLGTPDDVRQVADMFHSPEGTSNENQLRRITFFVSFTNSSPIVTYTDDTDRVRTFMATVNVLRGRPVLGQDQPVPALDSLPFAATQTILEDSGFQRITRSPLGQFSTLLPLVVPEEPVSAPRATATAFER